jgi:lysophospholipase L1-like esterase
LPTWGFRLFWRSAVLLSWLGLAALALHRSATPEVLGRWSPAYAAFLGMALALCIGLALVSRRASLARIQARSGEALLLAGAFGFALLSAELYLRVFDPIGLDYYTELLKYAKDRVPDPVVSYRHPPSTTHRYQGVEVRYNEAGLRDRPIAPKADREWRVLMLGDSLVFGWGVEQERIFSAELEELLAEDLQRPVRVINAGVCSYNTVTQLAWLRRDGLGLEPDLVVLVYATNDIGPIDAVWARRHEDPASQPFTHRAMSVLSRSWLYKLGEHVRRARTPEGFPGDAGWQASMQALRELVRETQAHGIGMATYLWAWRLDELQNQLLAAMRSALTPTRVEPVADWYDEPVSRWYNSAADHHPNSEAHAVAAQRMLESLRAQGLLPGAPPALADN